jgi:hypothetical protein
LISLRWDISMFCDAFAHVCQAFFTEQASAIAAAKYGNMGMRY